MAGKRVLVVADVMLDEYLWGSASLALLRAALTPLEAALPVAATAAAIAVSQQGTAPAKAVDVRPELSLENRAESARRDC